MLFYCRSVCCDVCGDTMHFGVIAGAVLNYRTDQQLETNAYNNGLLPYGGGGFAIDIPLYFKKAEVLEFFTYLKSQRWTDLHTRAVFFDFALYNPVNGLFLSVRLLFEFLPYGQVIFAGSKSPMTTF